MNDERESRRGRSMPGRRQSGGLHDTGKGAYNQHTGEWATPDDTPVDISAVQFDDAFLDALSRDVPTPTRDDAEYELAGLLSAWRHESLAEPLPLGPSVAEVEKAIAAQGPSARARTVVRTLRIVAGAAAVAVVAAAGLTVMSQGSEPGDPLWGVKKVVFAQAASETQAAYDVRSNLEKAEAELAAGNTQAAESLIAKAQSSMGPVRDSSTRTHMDEWIGRLRADTGATLSNNPSATSPGGGNVDTSGSATSDPAQPTDQLMNQSQTNPAPTAPHTTPPTTTEAPPQTTTKPPTTTPTTTTTAANDGPSSSWPPTS
ncbi:anti-sigma-D factor RsdA [Gordonia otitidis]|uniref:anti-sigma-D factor RsdA n=1 Tax=Gordonia otitidis TaxID=249058 RepID=UPI0023526842|nr:anti-sigma-D factor RsdA [Gordonia otitidis]